MAIYLEEIKWRIRFSDIHHPDESNLTPTLPVLENEISRRELERAIVKLKANRASGQMTYLARTGSAWLRIMTHWKFCSII
eukprot:9510318-Karenia_brevis.AAC.1